MSECYGEWARSSNAMRLTRVVVNNAGKHFVRLRSFANSLIVRIVIKMMLGGALLAVNLSYAFDLDALVQQIKNQNISSVEEFLAAPLLSDEKSRVLFIKNSRSLQASNVENPRALMVGEEGQLLLSFNGGLLHSNARFRALGGDRSVELAVWNAQSSLHDFYSIEFMGSGESHERTGENVVTPGENFKLHGPNPSFCISCHPGQMLNYIFMRSQTTQLLSAAERQSFLDLAPGKSRYQSLPLQKIAKAYTDEGFAEATVELMQKWGLNNLNKKSPPNCFGGLPLTNTR